MISVREATPEDVAQMHQMINELAEYEKAPDEVIATELDLMKALFGRDFSSVEYDQHDSISSSDQGSGRAAGNGPYCSINSRLDMSMGKRPLEKHDTQSWNPRSWVLT
jgi:hypothetical protein